MTDFMHNREMSARFDDQPTGSARAVVSDDELFKKYTVYVDGTHDEVCSLDESTWAECDEFP